MRSVLAEIGWIAVSTVAAGIGRAAWDSHHHAQAVVSWIVAALLCFVGLRSHVRRWDRWKS